MLASLGVPATKHHAEISNSPQLDLTGTSRSTRVRMAGNAMSVPTMGVMILAAVMGLKANST